ncbi:MAG TPA: response regulator [Gemmataceae bacterium]|nr:response regulator [Gemmataceae bacterium]
MASQANILLVDDHEANLLALEAVLQPLGQELIKARSGEEALRLLLQNDFAVVLLDIRLGAMDGFEVAQCIRSQERSKHTPIIFVTAFESEDFSPAQAYTLGAVDYLVKPLVPQILRAKVEVFIELHQRTEQVRQLQRYQTEQVRAELAAIVESSEDAIISGNLQGIVTSWNKGAERLYGYSAAEAIGKPISLLHPAERANEFPNLLERLRRGERIEPYQTVRLRKDGSRVDVSLSVSPIKDGEGKIIGAAKIARDIGPQKRLEEELRQHAEELAEAHRQKDQFLAMLAHELRNPMAPLRTGVHILRQSQTPPDVRERTHDMMDRQLRHLSRLVDDLLDVSRIMRGKIELRKESIDLRQLARTVAEDRRPVLEQAGLTLLLDVPETPVWVIGDFTRMTQILNNLLDNSVKFTKGRNKVAVRVVADLERRLAVLSVRDEGMGIEPQLLPRLFTPFLQADRSLDRSRGGLGLGLATVKGLAELHGGSVEATSEGAGQGAEFTVRLPLSEEMQVPSETPAAQQPSANHLRVLVIEDNRDAADSLRLLLDLLGHEARVAYSGPEGVAMAKEWRPDVVLCDIGLPGMDGYEASRQLRQFPGTAKALLVAITGYGQESDIQRSKEAGIDCHFLKPIDPAKLKNLLANVRKTG